MITINAAEARQMADKSEWLLDVIMDGVEEACSRGITMFAVPMPDERSEYSLSTTIQTLKDLGYKVVETHTDDPEKTIRCLEIHW